MFFLSFRPILRLLLLIIFEFWILSSSTISLNTDTNYVVTNYIILHIIL